MNKGKKYPGQELDLFAEADNWQSYIRDELKDFIGGHVLEVGAGIGKITKKMITGKIDSWTCLEPDGALADRIPTTVDCDFSTEQLKLQVIVGDIDHPACNRKFDTILYIDVLEHIQDDRLELQKAAKKLKAKGCIIVLSPAHQFLYSPFDQRIGHFRRYHRKGLTALQPDNTKQLRVRYLDSAGCLASLGNKMILRSDHPDRQQIAIWDRIMVPCSRILDPMLFYKIGKSIYIVWRKEV